MSQFEPPQEKLTDKGTSEVVLDNSEVRIIVPKNEEAACYYGQGTRWCTAATQSHNMFDHYNRIGSLYIILPKKPRYEGEKYQLHFPSEQFMDENDDQVDLVELIDTRFPFLHEFFLEREPSLKNLVIFAENKILQSIWEEIGERAMEIAYEEFFYEWEMNDDTFRDWQAEQAIKKEYIDEEGDIDWDRVHEDDELNDYGQYNEGAAEFLNDVRAVSQKDGEKIRELAYNYWSEGESYQEEQLTLTGLEYLFAWRIEKEVDGDAKNELAKIIERKIGVRKNREGKYEVFTNNN
jgi:hypothetical protein